MNDTHRARQTDRNGNVGLSGRKGWFGKSRRALVGLTIAAGIAGSVWAQAQPAVALGDWRTQIWSSADAGDNGKFIHLLDSASDPSRPDLFAMRDSAMGLKASLEHREKLRGEEREKLEKQLNDEIAAGAEAKGSEADFSVSRSLRYAIALWMISPDKDAVLKDPRVTKLVDRASWAARNAESRADWLTANDLYLNLNALLEEQATFRPDVERLISRLAMVRLYAPERLWELRGQRRTAEREFALSRAKDDAERETIKKNMTPLPPYNPVGDRWNEKLAPINETMVQRGLGRSVANHVEGVELVKMLRSGLDALRTFATTEDLKSAFPGLGQEAARVRFLEELDHQEERLTQIGGRADIADLAQLIMLLKDINEKTVQMPTQALMHEFANGSMRALDEFSTFIWPDEMSRFNKSTQAKFVGIGVHIVMDDSGSLVKVLTPLAGTPAHEAGLRPGDLITAVNGQSAMGFTTDQAVDVITGNPGTNVTLTIERADAASGTKMEKTFTMTRREIKLPTVKGWKRLDADEDKWDWFIDPTSRIGYVRLTQFAETTDTEFQNAIAQMKREGMKGLILDLRFNPGGLLDQAVAIVNRFVAQKAGVPFDGIVVTTHDRADKRLQSERMSSGIAPLADTPTVVLVNEGAASASEIVSGALQDYARAGAIRAVLVGARSFGKGSVQNVWLLSNDASAALKVTTQYYKLPNGRLIHRRPGDHVWGVEPNFNVEMLPSQITDAYVLRQNADVYMLDEAGEAPVGGEKKPQPNPDDLITKGTDLQLHHALVLLQTQVADAPPSLVAIPSELSKPKVEDEQATAQR